MSILSVPCTNRHDRQRFLMIRNIGEQEAGALIVVENFFEELKARAGN